MERIARRPGFPSEKKRYKFLSPLFDPRKFLPFSIHLGEKRYSLFSPLTFRFIRSARIKQAGPERRRPEAVWPAWIFLFSQCWPKARENLVTHSGIINRFPLANHGPRSGMEGRFMSKLSFNAHQKVFGSYLWAEGKGIESVERGNQTAVSRLLKE